MRKDLLEKNPLLRLSFGFSLAVISYGEQLEAAKKFVIARQLVRSATSIGANAMEAQHAESRPDFIHKLKVAAKEAEETQYWLMLCDQAPGYPDCESLLPQLEELQKVLGKIISSARKNSNNPEP